MSLDIAKIQEELICLGYQTLCRNHGESTVIEFDYQVETGTHQGENFRVGITVPGSTYPEYPPHWIHVSPPVDDGLGGSIERYKSVDGRNWIALSRPPNDIWDKLSEKNMKIYLSEHLRRFWDQI